MANKQGSLPPEVTLERLTARRQPRCQWVIAPRNGEAYGRQCATFAVSGRKFCRLHRGKSGRPPTTGLSSRDNPLPRDLRAKYEASLKDMDLLNLTKNIALLNAQIWQIAEPALELGYLGPVDSKDLLTFMEAHRQLVAQEGERRLAMGLTMDVRDMLVFIGYITDLIGRHVPDPDARRKIGAGLRKIVGEMHVDERATVATDTSGGFGRLEEEGGTPEEENTQAVVEPLQLNAEPTTAT